MTHPTSPRTPMAAMVAATAAISLVTSLGYGFAAAAIADSRAAHGSAVQAGAPGGGQQPGGQGDAHVMDYDYAGTYSGSKTADGTTETVSGGTVTATDADTNALLAQDGGTLSVSGTKASKGGATTNADQANFYGTNAVSLTVGSTSTTVLDDVSLTSDADGANAIFATDSGTVLAKDVTIATSDDNSRGIDATYGGTVLAAGLTASTKGDHSATIATDRGGGNISVDGATLDTAGSGSPLLYSTGNIQVHAATGTATGSQIAGMEGTNTILIADSTLTSTATGRTASDPVANGIIIYQSTSGDAEASTGERATFQAVRSTLSSAIREGAMFYCTNTSVDIMLQDTTLDFDAAKAALLIAAGNDANNWGQQGSNGADVTLTGRGQSLAGAVQVDSISSATVTLLDGSTWTGTATVKDGGKLAVAVDGTSTWTVAGDTTVTSLAVADGGKVVDGDGRSVTIVADGTTVIQGDGDVTVTVTGTYATTVDAASAPAPSEDLIDRKDFDAKFGGNTAWSMQ